jgi:glyoxylase-like metal-dependent hydrolase (beta-lactamase superfamily II)
MVGDPMSSQYQVTIVQYGTRLTEKSDVFLNYRIHHEPDAPFRVDYFFWVISNAERTVVVDTGFSKDAGESRGRSFVVDPAFAFDALGVDPSTSPDVLITHAHYDHAGNLGLFPQSTITIAAAEYAFSQSGLTERAQFAYAYDAKDVEELAAANAAGRLRTFSGSIDIAPGITMIEIGGHTAGQSVVVVDTPEGTVLIASDAIHFYEEFDLDRPFAFVGDLAGTYLGFDTIRALTESDVKHLVSGHDPDTLNRFSPITDGPLAGFAATIGGAPASAG